jgi:hypothetical protein
MPRIVETCARGYGLKPGNFTERLNVLMASSALLSAVRLPSICAVRTGTTFVPVDCVGANNGGSCCFVERRNIHAGHRRHLIPNAGGGMFGYGEHMSPRAVWAVDSNRIDGTGPYRN